MITGATNPALADQWVALGNAWRCATVHGLANVARLLHGKPPVETHRGAAHASTVVGVRDGVRLLRYPCSTTEKRGTLLVVASLINQFYVLDLLEGVSVIQGFCDVGMDVLVLDWLPPGRAGLTRGFEDYVDGFIPWAVEQAGEPVHVLGYSMGGTLALMHAALHPTQVKTLTLMGTPVDFHKTGILSRFTERRFFDADLVVDALGNLPPWMYQTAFKSVSPRSSLMHKFWEVADKGDDEDEVRHFMAVESWLEDNTCLPGGLYRPYIKELYQENRLIRGEMTVGGRKVELGAMEMPVLNIIGLKDNLVNVEGARALMPLLKNGTAIEFDTGHIGLSTSKRAHRELWPQVHVWVTARS